MRPTSAALPPAPPAPTASNHWAIAGERTESGGGRSLDYSYGQEGSGGAGEVAVGTRVRHPIFGPGTSLAVMGSGANQKLRIRFQRAGVKTVLVRYANLELG